MSSDLSKVLQEKAKNELHEHVETRQKDIEALRELVKADLGESLTCTSCKSIHFTDIFGTVTGKLSSLE